jgi:primosomal protein N' (replication factor Y) (superfamily II helicase)
LLQPSVTSTGSPLVARIVPDVTGLDKEFDYIVPESLRARIALGDRVRVSLHGRRVGGWVVELNPPDAAPGRTLLPLIKWSSRGPSGEVIDLCRWVATRWGTDRLRPLLVTASAPTMVPRIDPRPVSQRAEHATPASLANLDSRGGVIRLPPTTDPLPLVLDVATLGRVLLIHPSVDAAKAVSRRLNRAGRSTALMPDEWARAANGVDVVVGGRAAVLAPCPGLAAIAVLDEHDESLQEERTPTWHARDVAIERARRAGIPCFVVSPAPSAMALHWAGGSFVRPPIADERAGWPLLEVVDRTNEEPWKRALVTSQLIRHLRNSEATVVCVLNTTGRARLLACRSCRSIQRCEVCEAAVQLTDDGQFECRRCGTVRPQVCQVCGSGAMANLKLGVTRAREELEAAAGRPVVAVTGESEAIPDGDVFVGTEAVLHRVRRADVVAFLDFDSELMAPRYRAAEQAFTLLVRAARIVGPRARGGRVLVQTFLPQHEVVQAAVLADPGRLAASELARRELLGMPPFRALASIEGGAAMAFATATGLEATAQPDAVLVRGDHWLTLGEALAETPRPKGSRLRVAVDPPRA